VREKLKDKNFRQSLKGNFGLELLVLVITVTAALVSRYAFLFYSIYGIFIMYNKIKDFHFVTKNRYWIVGIIALFVTATSVIILNSKNTLFLYWNLLFIVLSRQLMRIFRQIFEKENLNIFSFNCLVIYALANTIWQWTIFKDNGFNMLGIMNILIILSVFLQEKIFERYKVWFEADYKTVEYLFFKKFYIFIIPILIEFVFYLFKLIRF
jgi:hypothetical protein